MYCFNFCISFARSTFFIKKSLSKQAQREKLLAPLLCSGMQKCVSTSTVFTKGATPSSDPELYFGASYSLPTYWIVQALIHSWAGRVLLRDALAQAVSWGDGPQPLIPALQCPPGPMPPSDFSARNISIVGHYRANPPGCIALLQHAQELRVYNMLKCIRFRCARELGVINLAQVIIAIYTVLQCLRKDRWRRC